MTPPPNLACSVNLCRLGDHKEPPHCSSNGITTDYNNFYLKAATSTPLPQTIPQTFVKNERRTCFIPTESHCSLKQICREKSHRNYSLSQSCHCPKLNCADKLTKTWQRQLRCQFWDSDNFHYRRKWLLNYIVDLKSRKLLPRTKSNIRRKWFLPDSAGNLISVCRTFFVRTLFYRWTSILSCMLKKPFLPGKHFTVKCCCSKNPESQRLEKVRLLIFKHIKSFLKKYHLPVRKFNGNFENVYDYRLIKRSFQSFTAAHPCLAVSYKVFRNIFHIVFALFSDDPTYMSIMPPVLLLRRAYNNCDLIRNHRKNNSWDSEVSKKAAVKSSTQCSTSTRNSKGISMETTIDDECKRIIMHLDNNDIVITQNTSDNKTSNEEDKTASQATQTSARQKTSRDKPSQMSDARTKTNLQTKPTKEDHPLLPPCKCRLHCFAKISESRREEIYHLFWGLQDLEEQTQWVDAHRHICHLKRRRKGRKPASETYFLTTDTKRTVVVCAAYFQRTLGFTGLNWFSSSSGCTKHSGQTDHEVSVNIHDHISVEHFVKSHLVFTGKANKTTSCSLPDHKTQSRSIKTLYNKYKTAYPQLPVSFESFQVIYHQVWEITGQHSGSGDNKNADSSVLARQPTGRRNLRKVSIAVFDNRAGEKSEIPPRRMSSRTKRNQVSPTEEKFRKLDVVSHIISTKNHQRDTEKTVHSSPDFNPKLGQSYSQSKGPVRRSGVPTRSSDVAVSDINPNWQQPGETPTQQTYQPDIFVESNGSHTKRRKISIQNSSIACKERFKQKKNCTDKSVCEQVNNSKQQSKTTQSSKRRNQLNLLTKKQKHPLLPPCACIRRRCIDNIPEERRTQIHAQFWNLNSSGERNRWLLRYVEKREHQIKTMSLFPQRKNVSKRYFLPNGAGETIEVCRLFFIRTLGFKWDSGFDAVVKTKSSNRVVEQSHHHWRKPARKLPDYITDSVQQYLKSIRDSKTITKDTEIASGAQTGSMGERESEDLRGMRIKDLFNGWKTEFKNLKFNLGYHSFRRIFQSVAHPTGGTNEDFTNNSVHRQDPEDGDELFPLLVAQKETPSTKDSFQNYKSVQPKVLNTNCVQPTKVFNTNCVQPKVFNTNCVQPKVFNTNCVQPKVFNTNCVQPKVFNTNCVQPKVFNTNCVDNCKLIANMNGKADTESGDTGLASTDTKDKPTHPDDRGSHFKELNSRTSDYSADNTVDCFLDVSSGYFKQVDNGNKNREYNGEHQNKNREYNGEHQNKNCRSLSTRNDRSNYPVLPPCKCRKRKCADKFSDVRRQHINDTFWSLTSYNERKQWILEHIKRTDIKRRVVFTEGTPRKLESRWYYLPGDNGCQIDVCKAFFLRTLGYRWDSVIDTVGRTTPKGGKWAVPDKRGRKPPPHKISDEAVSSMTLYIENVCHTYQPLRHKKNQDSSSDGKSSPAIPCRLTMKQLFEDYKCKHTSHKFGYESFRKIFRRVYDSFQASSASDSVDGQEETDSENADLVVKDYIEPAREDCSGNFLSNNSHVVNTAKSYAELTQYTTPSPTLPPPLLPPPTPLPPRSRPQEPPQQLPGASVSEPKSCLYQYNYQNCQPLPPPAMQALDTCPPFQPGQYNPLDHEKYLKCNPGQINPLDAEKFLKHNPSPVNPLDHEKFLKYNPGPINPLDPEKFLKYKPGPVNPLDHEKFLKYNPGPINPLDHEKFLKYHPGPVNPLDHEKFLKCNPGLYSQPSDTHDFSQPSTYTNTTSPTTDSTPPPKCGNQTQFPPYFMPNPEPLRRQVYHMATQYQSILHQIAESSGFFNYGGYQPQNTTYPRPNDRHIHPKPSPDVPRDGRISYNTPKTLSNFISSPIPTQYSHTTHLSHNRKQQCITLISTCTDESDNNRVHNHNATGANNQNTNTTNFAPEFICQTNEKKPGLTDKHSSKKGKKSTPKLRRESKLKPKSARNYADHYPMLPPCNCKKKKCVEVFSESNRKRIHDLFWNLKDYNDRKQWMLHHIKRQDCKRRRIDQVESFRKQESRWYFFPDENGAHHEVCKDFFLRTLGYKWDSVIDTIRRTTPKGETSTRPDQRGRKAPAHKLSSIVLRSVVQYIESMQQVSQPHVTNSGAFSSGSPQPVTNQSCKVASGGENESRGEQIAIPYGLTMKDLYEDYKVKHARHKIGYESFRRIFRAVSKSEKNIFDDQTTDDGILNSYSQDFVDL